MARFSADFKDKILREVKEVGSVAIVARKNNLPTSTVHTWIKKAKNSTESTGNHVKNVPESKALKKKLKELELENEILKELLKKTNHAWLGE